ncbi:MAG: hypothetical protein P4L54_05055 [Acidocella sp.]|nr:hypothetical protein [Acidocella sp.]
MRSSRNRKILFTSSAGLAQRVVQLLSTLITLPLVLHSLGVAGFGIWAAASSLAWLSTLLDFGLGSALLTLIPQSLGRGDTSLSRDYITAALYGGTTMALLLIIAGLLALAIHAPATGAAPFIIAAGAIALNIPLGIGSAIWLGLQKGYIGNVWQIVQIGLTTALLLIAAAAHAGVTLMTAATYAGLLISNTAALAHALLGHPAARPYRRLRAAALRTVLAQGSQMFAITVAAFCAYAFDNILALAWLGPIASAQMAISLRVCTTATGMLGTITTPFWPGFADAVAAQDHHWLKQTLRNGTLGTAALAITGSGCLIVAGAPLLRWWLQQDFHFTPALLWMMAAWIILTSLPQMPGLLLNAVSQLRPQIIILAIAAALSFGLKYLAAPKFGVIGILAVPPLMAALIINPAYFWLASRWLTRHTQTHSATKATL